MRRFLQLAFLGFKNVLDFKGRTSLRAYLSFALFCLILFGAPILALSYLISPEVSNILYVVGGAFLAVPFTSILFRRLHDVDHTSLALGIPFLIIVIVRIAQEFINIPMWFSSLLYGGSFIFIMYIIFLIHAWPGNPDANAFGYVEEDFYD